MKDLVYHRTLLPAAERYADNLATVDGEFTATYAEHTDRVLRLGHALNNHNFLELWHAGFLGAGVVNPLNLRLAPKELEFILSDSGCNVVFVDAIFAPLIDKVREAAGVKHVVLIGQGDVPHDVAYEDLISAGEPVVPPELDED